MSGPVVFIDADNTLWDTDAVFAEAQLGLLGAVERAVQSRANVADRLAYIRSLDQAIAERHHAGLRYPPSLLVRATELALGGQAADTAAKAAWRGGQSYRIEEQQVTEIEQRYFAELASPPKSRPGVLRGLKVLREAGCRLLIVTEGQKAKVERNATRLKLADFFDRIIEGPKGAQLYRRVLALTASQDQAFMVGDQLDRDIVPAKAAGVETIWFPGGFRPRWSPAEDSARPDHVVRSFAEVPDIVLAGARATPTLRAAGR